MVFGRKKRLILVFFIILIVSSFNVSADSSVASWTRAYCLYNAGSGGYACDSGQVAGDSASCSVANGVQCAQEGNVYCYSQSSCETYGASSAGPINAYNVNWDGDSADCSCIGGTWTGDGGSSNCCGDDLGEDYCSGGYTACYNANYYSNGDSNSYTCSCGGGTWTGSICCGDDAGEVCSPSATQCSGNWVQTCSASCTWGNTQNCDASDGCNGDFYLNYYCSDGSCSYSSDDCSDCSCSCGGYNVAETVANGNCNDGKDNDCDGLTDCADTNDCHGQPGPSGVTCCQSSTVDSDCSAFPTGNCGELTCTSNICDVVKNTNLCSATTGDCGYFLDTCSGSTGGPFTCDYAGNNDLCTCDKYCGGGYSCTDVSCTQPNVLDYCEESTSLTCHPTNPQACTEQYPGLNTCVCHGCSTCPSTSTGGSTSLGGPICP